MTKTSRVKSASIPRDKRTLGEANSYIAHLEAKIRNLEGIINTSKEYVTAHNSLIGQIGQLKHLNKQLSSENATLRNIIILIK